MLDLVVIGAGLSGLTAAYAAAQAGLHVRVVAKGMGAIYWNAGTLDVLGYLPGADREPVTEPLRAISALPEHHPYRLVGADTVRRSLQTVCATLAAEGLPYRGAATPEHNLLLPSPLGVARPVYQAPEAQLAGDLSRSEPMLIVGFHGLRDFYSKLIAENLARRGLPVRQALLPWELLTGRRDRNHVQLAEGLDAPAAAARLSEALRKLAQPGERIGLPAILGLERHSVVLDELREGAGVPIFEIPTLPPSVPGLRLYRALRRALLAAGSRIETNMEAIGFHAEDRRVRWVETATSSRPLRHAAQRFVLATGGVLGGGFNSEVSGRFWETVFDLPLTVAQDRRYWFRAGFFDPAGQPVFAGGATVDAALQPTDGSGRRLYENLWAAGSLLAHADGISERSLEGVAVSTGFAAAAALQGFVWR